MSSGLPMRVLYIAFAAIIAGAVALTYWFLASETEKNASPAANTSVAFVADDGAVTLSVDENTSRKTLVGAAECGADVLELVWAPDGTKLFCSGQTGGQMILIVADANGRILARVSDAVLARWSANSNLAYTIVVPTGTYNLYTLNGDGSPSLVASDVTAGFAWSESGDWIAFGRGDAVEVLSVKSGDRTVVPARVLAVEDWVLNDRSLLVKTGSGDNIQVSLVNLNTSEISRLPLSPRQYWLSPDRLEMVIPTTRLASPEGELAFLNIETLELRIITDSKMEFDGGFLPPDTLAYGMESIVWVNPGGSGTDLYKAERANPVTQNLAPPSGPILGFSQEGDMFASWDRGTFEVVVAAISGNHSSPRGKGRAPIAWRPD